MYVVEVIMQWIKKFCRTVKFNIYLQGVKNMQ